MPSLPLSPYRQRWRGCRGNFGLYVGGDLGVPASTVFGLVAGVVCLALDNLDEWLWRLVPQTFAVGEYHCGEGVLSGADDGRGDLSTCFESQSQLTCPGA